MAIELKKLGYDERSRAFGLYEKVFGRDALERWDKRFDWQFLKSPGAINGTYNMWIGENSQKEILGFYASFPINIKIGKNVETINCPCDLMVDSKARGEGLGRKIVEAYINDSKILINAFGYTPPAGKLYKKLGYREVAFEPVNLRIFDFSALYQFLIDSSKINKKFDSVIIKHPFFLGCKMLNLTIGKSKFFRWPKISSNLKLEHLNEDSRELDDLWDKNLKYYDIVIVRDRKFIKWRFFDDPAFKNTLYGVRNRSGELMGYIAMNITFKKSMKVGRIMDIFCNPNSDDVIDALMFGAFKFFKDDDVHAISCLGLHQQLRKSVKKYLYISPASMNRPALILNKEKSNDAIVYDEKNWHFSHADGDEGFAP